MKNAVASGKNLCMNDDKDVTNKNHHILIIELYFFIIGSLNLIITINVYVLLLFPLSRIYLLERRADMKDLALVVII